MKKKILLAMSGGVDSSIAAYLLKQQGHEIIGITFITYDDNNSEIKSNLAYINDAREIAAQFGINHYVIDIQEEFKDITVSYFIDEYIKGRTPNPCVVCNPKIKWKFLYEYAEEFGCDFYATGHYAKINYENNRYYISEGDDKWKDQSYFLWKLSQKYLKKTLFPLGDYNKKEIKELASKLGYTKLSQKKESYDVCFIKEGDYRDFLKENVKDFDKKIKPGNIINSEGKILGTHNGYPFYTIGQRKGLGIATGHPMYVIEIRPETNTIVLGEKSELGKNKIKINNYHFQKYKNIPDNIEINTKIRYKQKAVKSKLFIKDNIIEIIFSETVFGVTPGQSAVFYEGEDLIGGGFII